MSVTVKVFYERSNGQKEIRRFAISTSPGSDSFTAIRDKVKELYASLSHGHFEIFWQDSDGDRIAFSTNVELREALGFVTDGVLRVYIPEPKEQPRAKSQASQDNGQPGNTKKPQQASSDQGTKDEKQQSQEQSQSNPESEPLHPYVTCDGCEGSVRGIRYKCCVCDDYDLCSSCEEQGIHSEHDMYKITKPRVDPFAFLPPHLGRHLHRYMNRSGASSSSSASAGAHAQSSFHSASDDYLNKMGANIAAFLDPFGIDVTFDVHDNGEHQTGGFRRGCGARGRGGRCGNRQGGSNGWGFCPAWEEMEKRYASEKKKGTTTESSVDKDVDMKSPEPTPSQDVPMEEDKKKETPKQGCKNGGAEEWTFVSDQEAHQATANSTTPIPMPAPAPHPSAQAPQSSAPSQGAAPNVTSGQTQANIYPNLRIQQSLDQMLAMGFTNTGNWLSDLLTEYDGDIGATLDAVKAKATQQLDSFRGPQ